MGITKNPQIIAGLKTIIVTHVEDRGIIAKKIIVINTPLPNNIKSKGLKIPKIN